MVKKKTTKITVELIEIRRVISVKRLMPQEKKKLKEKEENI